MKRKKVILIVRDGWGYKEKKTSLKKVFSKKQEIFNAIEIADTKNTDSFEENFPTIFLDASGGAVGLPSGFVGNSEVGHITMGAGNISDQSLLRISESIESGKFLRNESILKAIQNIKEKNSQLHLMILMQDAGVHSHIEHLFETMRYCKKEGLKNDQVVLHLMTDGRDSDPESGIAFLAEVAEHMETLRVGNVGTISGRYFAMDRNKNEERTEKYFQAFFNAKSSEKFSCGMEKIHDFYKNGTTDEFIPPLVKEGYEGVFPEDSIVFLNFRKDRSIQVSQKISEQGFENFYTMTNYAENINSETIFTDEKVENTLGDILEKNNKKQLRISETEKYAHVTFFFDGGVKKEHKGKKEIMVKSPDVTTYNLKPEMSSKELNKEIISNIEKDEFDFILVNYPNVDMVAHTGDLKATVKAVESVDHFVGLVVESALEKGYIVMLTADHGNAEEISETKRSHTKNKVPFTLISKEFEGKEDVLKEGRFGLENIAPTVLELMDIEKNDKSMLR